MSIDPLDTATALARVEDRAVHDVRRCPGDIGIRAHVSGVVAAQLEVDGDDAVGRRAADGEAAAGRAGEADLSDLGELDDGLELVSAAEVEDLQDVFGEAGVVKGFF
jgi:hypothetical protein